MRFAASAFAYMLLAGKSAVGTPAPGSALVLGPCVDTSGQCYYVSPAGYPFKQVLRNAYTSPIPLCWTVNATGALSLDAAQTGNVKQTFNYTSSSTFVSLNSSLCVTFDALVSGAPLHMAPCNSSTSQVLVYDSTQDGHVVAGHLGSGLCVGSAP